MPRSFLLVLGARYPERGRIALDITSRPAFSSTLLSIFAVPKLTAVTIERIRGDQARQEVIDYLEAHEPEATPALVALTRPVPRRYTKTWVVRDSADGAGREGRGEIVGVLVSSRYCFDRWNGTLLLE